MGIAQASRRRVVGSVAQAAHAALEPLEQRRLLSATFSTIYDFQLNGADPVQPQQSLTADAQGNLYGCSYLGGAYGMGALFELRAGQSVPVVLHSFQNNGADGVHPEGKVAVDAAGNLYGFTDSGGAETDGTVWELPAGSTTLQIIYNFMSATDGTLPLGLPCLDSSGNLYGVTFQGGASDDGEIFELAAGTHQKSTLYSFGTATDDGINPDTVIIDSQGDLFGTCRDGGLNSLGNVFELTIATDKFTVLHQFSVNDDGDLPYGGVDADPFGNLWLASAAGGNSSDGAIVEFKKNGSSFDAPITVVSFPGDGSDGANSYSDVSFDAAGDLFGTTSNGGSNNLGTVFELPVGTSTIVPLHSFAPDQGVSVNAGPHGAPTVTAGGNLIGTTYEGGAHGAGEIYEISGAISGTAVTTNLAGGNLLVTGTGAGDVIAVSGAGSQITVSMNGFPSLSYLTSQVSSIDVEAGGGDDTVALGAGVPGASVQGGPGDDTVTGGPGNDTLGGGAGNDYILGDGGDDSLRGGAGDDSLGGGQGNDVLLGSLDNDTLTGGAGNDTLIGGAGSNELHGGQGDDLVFAINGAADTLYGGLGNDTAHVDQNLDLIPNHDIETILYV